MGIDPSAFGREVIDGEEAVDFLRLSKNAFDKLAPILPR
jgi:hypothetical protein